MKKIILVISIFMLSIAATAQSVTPANRADWFKEAKFGMFVHWGLYSILGGSYNGHTLPDTTLKNGKSWYAEWVQKRLEVPDGVYRALASQFNPVDFDADQWIREAKNAGMRYFVITAKHHDGFAMWDSKVSDYDLGSTPYKKDILGELAKACKKYGLKYGFYYSHWQDWEYPGGARPYWEPTVPDDQFETYWRKKSLPQIKELIERYNPDLFWFDTWNEESHITDARRDELIAMIRKLSPKCLVNGRISFYSPGNDIDFLEMFDNAYPDKILDKPWQTPATIVHSWGWHATDYNWKPTAEMLGYLIGNTAKGGNYLLNIGPKPDGTFPVAAIRRLREMGGWLVANGEAVYGTQPVKAEKLPENVLLSGKKAITQGYIIYASITNPMSELELPFNANTIVRCSILETAMPLDFSGTVNSIKIKLPAKLVFTDDKPQVVKIELKEKP